MLARPYWTFHAFKIRTHHLLKSALSGLKQFLAIKSPLNMKNAFYFTGGPSGFPTGGPSGPPFISISNFMTSQPGQQTIVTSVLLIISRSKANQTMKFCQWIEYNMRNSFPEKSYRKCGGEASPRPFPRKLKLSISLDQ